MNYKLEFLKQVENFMDELIEIFPEEKSLMIFKERYLLLKKMNSNKILESFIVFVLPFKEKIMNEDDTYFIDGGGQEKVPQDTLAFRDSIKNLWLEKMSEQNRKISWKYFKIFVLLSEKYLKEKYMQNENK